MMLTQSQMTRAMVIFVMVIPIIGLMLPRPGGAVFTVICGLVIGAVLCCRFLPRSPWA